MKIIRQAKDEIVMQKEFPGIAECVARHKISGTETTLTYAGPLINREEWHKVLSFFRWTYKEFHSEAQVRGFIDPVDNKFIFWAFPQRVKTGMSSDELPGEEFDKQRAALPHSAELIYFLTNHHHCECTAFQSGGDSNNEERPGGGANETGQDGLHITMGKMDEGVHDMDVRFYLQGTKIIPSVSLFWDISKEIKDIIPATMYEQVARFQMCQKVDVPFPEEWKTNCMVVKDSTPAYVGYQGGLGHGCGGYLSEPTKSLREKIEDAADEVVSQLIEERNVLPEDLCAIVDYLAESVVIDRLVDITFFEKLDTKDLLSVIREIPKAIEEYIETEFEQTIAGEVPVDKPDKKGKRGKKRKGRWFKAHPVQAIQPTQAVTTSAQASSNIAETIAADNVEKLRDLSGRTKSIADPDKWWNHKHQRWERPDGTPVAAVQTGNAPGFRHGEVRDNGQVWDSDLRQWTDAGAQDGYGA